MILTHLVMFSFFNGATASDAPAPTPTVTVQVGGIGRKRKHSETVVYEEREKAPDLSTFEYVPPAVVSQAIDKVLAQNPPDDSVAVKALRGELHRLRVKYRPEYAKVVRKAFNPDALELERRLRREEEEDLEVILLLH